MRSGPSGSAGSGAAEALERRLGVSRETRERLEVYAALLRRWQGAINLVARSTLDDAWTRHILDSAQLFPLLPPDTETLVDLGSGAGFPGLVLAILGVPKVHLVESDARKAAFLREVARATDTPVDVHVTRIERMTAIPADVVTARALASLTDLIGYARPFLKDSGVALFLKGRQVGEELTEAAKHWTMRVERFDSMTEDTSGLSGTILRLGDISRA